MKNHLPVADSKLISEAFTKTGLPINDTCTNEFKNAVHCNFICNNDGSVRWLYPISSKHPYFLKFYHSVNARSLAFTLVIKLLFLLRLKKFVAHGNYTFYTNESVLQDNLKNDWALFTGTIGPNRKMLLWRKGSTGNVFTKIALTDVAAENIAREKTAISKMIDNTKHFATLPAIQSFSNNELSVSDINNNNINKTNRLKNLPTAALQNWCVQQIQHTTISKSNWYVQTKKAVRNIHDAQDKRIPKTILQKLEQLFKAFDGNDAAITSTAHGDFTPWNIMYNNDKLCMLDWELYEHDMPVLYDVFHFVYQSNILIGNYNYKHIRKELDAFFVQPEWIDFVYKNKIDLKVAEQSYLLYVVSYYLNVYSMQPQWHAQVTNLLKTWSEALTYSLQNKTLTARKLMLQDVAGELQNKNYAALKFVAGSMINVPETSDIDICIGKKDANEFISFLKQHVLVKKARVTHKSFMKQCELILCDNTFLHIDLVWSFKRKQWVYLKKEDVLSTSMVNAYGVRIPKKEIDFEYAWLFYMLNGSKLPIKYINWFASDKEKITQHIQQKYANPFTIFSTCRQNANAEKLWKTVKSDAANKGISYAKNILLYIVDTLNTIFAKRGYVITFSGVDGAGKTTIITNTKTYIEKQLRRQVVVLRHRPSLLPILSAWRDGKKTAEQNAAGNLPRQGSNKSVISSLIRFSYYYIDYLLGQFYVQLKYVSRGYVVLYDRYYFDFINDSKRSNIEIDSTVTKWLYRFLLKPKMNFFLYASPDEILKRKKELEPETITQLTENYLQLFKNLSAKYPSSQYLPVHNSDMNTTLTKVYSEINHIL